MISTHVHLNFKPVVFFFLSAKIIHIRNKKKKWRDSQDIPQFHKIKISKPCKLWVQGKCSCETEDCWYFHQDIACLTISFRGDQKSDSSCYFSYATKKQDITKLSKEFSKIKELKNIFQQKEHELQFFHSQHIQPTLKVRVNHSKMQLLH